MSNFILTLELKTQPYQKDILNKRLNIARQMYNACLGELYRRYNVLKQSKAYRTVCKMPKGKDRNKCFRDLNKEYGLTEYSLHTYVKPMQHHFKMHIDSFTAQKIATRCFKAFQNVMFHKSKRVHFKRFGDFHSVEGKSNKSGIRFKDHQLLWSKLIIPVIIKPNDIYAQTALENKIKYCRIVKKRIRSKDKYYLQLVLGGIPPLKIDKMTGITKNDIGIGTVGLDIGTQTIGVSSGETVKLLELAPEIDNIEPIKRRLLRKLDRQRRANNPSKYKSDGTIDVTNRDKWSNSKRYLKTKDNLSELLRKQAAIRKQSHEMLANYILSLGDTIKVETMDYKGLQARSKQTTINPKTGKYNMKRRFGKSLANKAPSMLLTILDNKLKWFNLDLIKVNTWTVKASQYNHVDNTYIKKDLSTRWNTINNHKIQRDLYSAFLIMNVNDDLDEIDQTLCHKTYSNFKILHDNEMIRLKNNKTKTISSMGL